MALPAPDGGTVNRPGAIAAPVNLATVAGKAGPECGNHTLIHKDGCEFCTACGDVRPCG